MLSGRQDRSAPTPIAGGPLSPLLALLGAALAAPPDPVLLELGADRDRGNLLGIQPWMTTEDYATAEAFRERLDGWLSAAAAKGWIGPRTVVVLPEYLGTWLVAVDQGPEVTGAATVKAAMGRMVKRRPIRFLGRYLGSKADDRAVDAIFHVRAEAMAEAYDGAFAALSAKWGVTVVAGSILLPEPWIEDGRLVTRGGRLQNVSVVYGPDGRAVAISRKVQPTEDELPFVAPADAEELPVVATPAGNLGVLVCADSWYPHPYENLADDDVQILAIPSFLSKDGGWAEPWHGYNGGDPPQDVDLDDVERLTEGEAWRRYALAQRGADSGAEAGMNVFLRGDLWDLGDDGQTIAILRREVHAAPVVDGPVIVNLWLGDEPLAPEAEEAAEAAGAPAN